MNITDINAMLIGCVSSGKSSLLNALVGGIISPASKDRQTFKPMQYKLNKLGNFKNMCDISKKINTQKNINGASFKENKINEEQISRIDKTYIDLSLPAKNNLYVTDFPGMGDERDTDNMFYKAVLNNISHFNLIMFVCDANKPFLQKEEVNYLEKIKEEIKKQYDEHQIFIDLIILVCKYDDNEDEELNALYLNIEKTIGIAKDKIFRFASYQLFAFNAGPMIYLPSACQQEYKNMYKSLYGNKSLKKIPELDLPIKFTDFMNERPQESGDWDNLSDYLDKLETEIIDNLAEPKYNKFCQMVEEINDKKYAENLQRQKIITKVETAEIITMKITEGLVFQQKHYDWCLGYFTDREYKIGYRYFGDLWFDSYLNNSSYDVIEHKNDSLKFGSGKNLYYCLLTVYLLEKRTHESYFTRIKQKDLDNKYDYIVETICQIVKDNENADLNNEKYEKIKDLSNKITKQVQMLRLITEKYGKSKYSDKCFDFMKNICAKTSYLHILETYAKYCFKDTHVKNNVCNLLINNYGKYKSLYYYIEYFEKHNKYDLLKIILQYVKTHKLKTDCYENFTKAYAVFKEFECDIKVYFTPYKLFRILKYNDKLENYIEKLYSERSKHNVRYFELDNHDKDKMIGSILFNSSYYENDECIKKCGYDGLIY